MLTQTENGLVWRKPLWARAAVVFASLFFAVLSVTLLLLSDSPQVSWLSKILVASGGIGLSLLIFVNAGASSLSMNFLTGEYHLVHGLPLMEKHCDGIITRDVAALHAAGNLLYIQWKNAKTSRFYMGKRSRVNVYLLAHRMNVPLKINDVVLDNASDQDDATLLRSIQLSDENLLQPSDVGQNIRKP